MDKKYRNEFYPNNETAEERLFRWGRACTKSRKRKLPRTVPPRAAAVSRPVPAAARNPSAKGAQPPGVSTAVSTADSRKTAPWRSSRASLGMRMVVIACPSWWWYFLPV